MEQKKNDGNYVVVNTKMRPITAARLERLARSRKMNLYGLVQLVCDTLVRYLDKAHNLSREMELAMSVFEHMIGWDNAFNLADPSAVPEIFEATYYIGAEGKKGVRAVHVKRPFFDQWTENFNIQEIFEQTICMLFPDRYMRLRQIATDMGCTTLLQVLDQLIDEHTQAADMDAIREEFEDADRSDWGIKPARNPYKRKKDTSMTLFERQELKEQDNG